MEMREGADFFLLFLDNMPGGVGVGGGCVGSGVGSGGVVVQRECGKKPRQFVMGVHRKGVHAGYCGEKSEEREKRSGERSREKRRKFQVNELNVCHEKMVSPLNIFLISYVKRHRSSLVG